VRRGEELLHEIIEALSATRRLSYLGIDYQGDEGMHYTLSPVRDEPATRIATDFWRDYDVEKLRGKEDGERMRESGRRQSTA
jgi:hypothetical protein